MLILKCDLLSVAQHQASPQLVLYLLGLALMALASGVVIDLFRLESD